MSKRSKEFFIKELILMEIKHLKRCSTSYVIRELQIKTTTRKNIWVELHILWWDDTSCNISNNDHVWGNKINLKFKHQKQWHTTIYLRDWLKSKTLTPNSSEDVGVEQQCSHLLLVIMQGSTAIFGRQFGAPLVAQTVKNVQHQGCTLCKLQTLGENDVSA